MRPLQLNYKRVNNRHFPILELPPEISTQIFIATFPENSFSSWGKETPLLLGTVCHVWRELAWSLPQLWASLSFTVKHYSDTKINLLEEWLARSRDLPLSIQLTMYKPQNKSGADVPWQNVIDIIARCSERWQAIDFELFYPLHPQICSVPSQLPLLVSMSMQLNELRFFLSNDYKYNSKAVWNAPKLQHIYASPFIGRYLDFHLNLSQKTTFSWVGSPCPKRCLEILKAAPNLVKCQFKYVISISIPIFKRVTASQLQVLQIGFGSIAGGGSMPQFLDNVTAPTLRELSISNWMVGKHVLFLPEVFVSFIYRSACHLLRLSLSNMTLPPDQLAICLSATPSLTELQLGGMSITGEIFKVLTLDKSSQNVLLPNLESFTYEGDHFDSYTFDFAGLVMMATSRWHVDPPISAPISLQRAVNLKSIHIDLPQTRARAHDYLDAVGCEDGSSGASERNDGVAEEGCVKLNRHLIARFRRLITEGMDIQIWGHFGVDLLNPEVKIWQNMARDLIYVYDVLTPVTLSTS